MHTEQQVEDGEELQTECKTSTILQKQVWYKTSAVQFSVKIRAIRNVRHTLKTNLIVVL